MAFMLNHFIRLYHFDHWANVQVVESLKSCKEMPEKAVSLLSHYLQEQWVALKLLTKQEATDRNTLKEYSFEECVAQIARLKSAWSESLSGLTDEQFEQSFVYTNAVGKETTRIVSDLLTDIVDHGTYHRGQIATLVREAGGEPAKTWFTRWVKETNRGTK